MELSRQITIVSAFGRGVWLAAALAKEGLKVTLIDVTSKLGLWPAEDAEGPFGFFRSDRLQELQLERIFCEDHFEEVPSGFTIWLEQGPVEFKSPLTGFYFEKKGWPSAYADVMNLPGQKQKNNAVYKSLGSQKFQQHWILNLAHQWSSTVYRPSVKALEGGKASSLLSTFYVRSATRTGAEKSLRWLREKDVEVLNQAEIMDISFGPGPTVTGVELQGGSQGLLKTDQLAWMLTSEETYFLDPKLGAKLYPGGMSEPEWGWVRYRIRLNDCPERETLPLHLLMMKDLNSPWTHENLMILQRTATADQFDAWIRLPNVQRFNKEYLVQRGEALCALLVEKMALSQPQIQTYPQEYYYSYNQLGASRFPVFAQESQRVFAKTGRKLGNVDFDGPETWREYSWEEQLDSQEQIRLRIVRWWHQQIQKMQSQNRKDKNP